MLKFRILHFLVVIIWIFAACKGKDYNHFPEISAIQGIARPTKLNPDKTTIFLQDFIPDVQKIDSVTFSEGISYTNSNDNPFVLELTYHNSSLPYYSFMKLWSGGYVYTIILEKSDKLVHSFSFNQGEKQFSQVSLAGDFNDWNPSNTPLAFNNGVWQTNLVLNPGSYQYQIVADGSWMLDSANEHIVSNNMGGYNSMLEVGTGLKEPSPLLYTSINNGSPLIIGYNGHIKNYYVFWDNFLLEGSSIDTNTKTINIEIPDCCKNNPYSFIRVFSENESGKSNDLMIPLENGKVITDYTHLTRFHKEAQIYYFLMIDRFFNGDTTNDLPVEDDEVAPLANFMGGDLDGVLNKIQEGYFEKLNISTLWLSPVVQNPLKAYNEYPAPHAKFSGYHGYWPVESTEVDFRFGTEDNLKALVEAAHSKHINVILDFVSNHVHEDNKLIKDNSHWATKLDLGNGVQNIRKWDEHRLTTWFDVFLPSLDFSQQEVIDTMVSIGLFWINKYDLDGFRHDATKHIPIEFWRAMTLKLKTDIIMPLNKPLLQIGETFGSRELIGSYVGHGLIDGQFDFNLYFDARNVFALDNESFQKAVKSLDASFRSYGCNSLMGNISGNHDLPRITSLASGDVRMDGAANSETKKGKVEITDTTGYLKTAQLMAFMLNIPGIPVIYYGDEIGMPGDKDPDNRRMMRFDNLNTHENKLLEQIQKLTKLRRTSLALNYGHFEWLKTDNDVLVFARKYFNETVIIVFNKSNISKIVSFELPEHLQSTFKSNFESSFENFNNTMNVNVRAYGFEVLN
ncbi:MAG: alpha-amylase family glycosyl hydrolase [Bacteroidales bacterium]|nr:alpha-amylase family glycosyl hydrolase [Bacteroidales bacterium]